MSVCHNNGIRGLGRTHEPPARPSRSRGQVATEFFIYTTIFMFVAIAAFFVVNNIQSTDIPLRENTVAKEAGDFFASSIALAVKGGPGFTYNYTFSRTILDTPYNLTFTNDNREVILDWAGSYGTFSQGYPLPPYNYSYSGLASDSGGNHIFRSDEGNNVLTLYNDGETLTISHGGQ
jgi:hypothetical protein